MSTDYSIKCFDCNKSLSNDLNYCWVTDLFDLIEAASKIVRSAPGLVLTTSYERCCVQLDDMAKHHGHDIGVWSEYGERQFDKRVQAEENRKKINWEIEKCERLIAGYRKELDSVG